MSLRRSGCQGYHHLDADAITAVNWQLHPLAEYLICLMTLWIRPSCGSVWHNLRVVSRILEKSCLKRTQSAGVAQRPGTVGPSSPFRCLCSIATMASSWRCCSLRRFSMGRPGSKDIPYTTAFFGIRSGKPSGSIHFVLKRARVIVIFQCRFIPALLTLLFGIGQRLRDDDVTYTVH